ncbi:hypothetical protein BDR26DRAFT_919117 [Obelidium mucronatum]|nr:hypothetical protein BDR26DRAFT_919117 [Obelidium mucronatum]
MGLWTVTLLAALQLHQVSAVVWLEGGYAIESIEYIGNCIDGGDATAVGTAVVLKPCDYIAASQIWERASGLNTHLVYKLGPLSNPNQAYLQVPAGGGPAVTANAGTPLTRQVGGTLSTSSDPPLCLEATAINGPIVANTCVERERKQTFRPFAFSFQAPVYLPEEWCVGYTPYKGHLVLVLQECKFVFIDKYFHFINQRLLIKRAGMSPAFDTLYHPPNNELDSISHKNAYLPVSGALTPWAITYDNGLIKGLGNAGTSWYCFSPPKVATTVEKYASFNQCPGPSWNIVPIPCLKTCFLFQCGQVDDNCGGTIYCGPCPGSGTDTSDMESLLASAKKIADSKPACSDGCSGLPDLAAFSSNPTEQTLSKLCQTLDSNAFKSCTLAKPGGCLAEKFIYSLIGTCLQLNTHNLGRFDVSTYNFPLADLMLTRTGSVDSATATVSATSLSLTIFRSETHNAIIIELHLGIQFKICKTLNLVLEFQICSGMLDIYGNCMGPWFLFQQKMVLDPRKIPGSGFPISSCPEYMDCGWVADGCGGTVSCGRCGWGMECGFNPQNICAPIPPPPPPPPHPVLTIDATTTSRKTSTTSTASTTSTTSATSTTATSSTTSIDSTTSKSTSSTYKTSSTSTASRASTSSTSSVSTAISNANATITTNTGTTALGAVINTSSSSTSTNTAFPSLTTGNPTASATSSTKSTMVGDIAVAVSATRSITSTSGSLASPITSPSPPPSITINCNGTCFLCMVSNSIYVSQNCRQGYVTVPFVGVATVPLVSLGEESASNAVSGVSSNTSDNSNSAPSNVGGTIHACIDISVGIVAGLCDETSKHAIALHVNLEEVGQSYDSVVLLSSSDVAVEKNANTVAATTKAKPGGAGLFVVRSSGTAANEEGLGVFVVWVVFVCLTIG